MGAKEFASLLGGLALFLYGMNMMSQGMEAAAGNKMKQILERLTTNRYLGVLVGAVITAIIQSSSATTVMVVGFVNSGMMTLRQAVGVIMGANIGTTITGQLIALDAGAIAPFIAFLGVVLVVFLKQPKVRNIGGILAGLGVLFIGMEMMSTAMMPLRDSKAFIDMMTKFSNPLLGIMAGCHFHSTDPVFIGIGRNPSGTCNKWGNFFFRGGVCAVWTKYRYLYHGSVSVHWYRAERKADDNHPSFV